MTHPSRYFADDKDVYDLLMSQPKRLGNKVICLFLRKRGFVVSPDTEREELVRYVSRLPLGLQDVEELMEYVSTGVRTVSRTMSEGVVATVQKMEDAAASVRSARSQRGETYRVSVRDDGGLDVVVDYTEMDTAKNRLRQLSARRLTLSVDPSGDSGVRVRYPDEPRAREIADAIVLEALGNPKSCERATITLAGCTVAQRTRFFELLTAKTDGFGLRSVTRGAFRLGEEVEGESVDESELPGFVDEDGGSRIVRVQLDGAGVFASEEYQELKGSGFFVSGAVWRAREDGGDGIDVEFDAGFGSGDTAEVFTYKLRGVFRRDEDGIHRQRRESPSASETRRLLSCLEAASLVAQKEVRESVPKEEASPSTLGEPATASDDAGEVAGDG